MSIKSTIAAAFAAPFLLSSAAFAGPYVNVEANASYPDGEYTSATTDLHFGFDGATDQIAYYVQGGPSFVHTDSTDDTETELSGKVGLSVAIQNLLISTEKSLVSLMRMLLAILSLTSVVKLVLSTHSKL